MLIELTQIAMLHLKSAGKLEIIYLFSVDV